MACPTVLVDLERGGVTPYFLSGLLPTRAIEERPTKLRTPFRSAKTFWIEEIISVPDATVGAMPGGVGSSVAG